ncbi:MAG: pyruvate, phosphate dikinase [candidate division NC10 bacterium]|nr:pyruvate, phosphate dikinase [candidate division NC10 bacterium]
MGKAKKYVYFFGSGKAEGRADMKDLLGGKGANIAEMTNAGLPVPPGFTITTEACNEYYARGKKFPDGLWEQILEALKKVEQLTGKRFGDPKNPLLVSVRSGAKFSMPGMMDTVLNLGLNSKTLKGLVALTQNERFGYDAYRRLIQMFGRIVMGIDGKKFDQILDSYKAKTKGKRDTDLTAAMLQSIIREYKALYKKEIGEEFPEDPLQQLRLAIEAVFGSWFGKRAVDYRNINKIPHDLGTAVNVQTMVFGNMGNDSGTGVAFTRNPSTGEKVLYGEYLMNAQGEDVVAGIRTPQKISELSRELPEVGKQFNQIAQMLEKHYREVQDLEFTVERGKLYMLQTRTGKRTAQAAVKIAVDMVMEGLISKEEALMRVEPNQVYQLLLPRFDEEAKKKARETGAFLASGLNASPGAASGMAIFDPDKAEHLGKEGKPVVLVRYETSPEDVHGMYASKGILTQHGGATSHAAVVARGAGLPCVAGCEAIKVDEQAKRFTVGEKVVQEGDFISIDGGSGEVFAGTIATIEPDFAKEVDLVTLLQWADEVRRLGVWANGDYPRDAIKAREFGAEGIGLCRTEHMFFETDRLPIVQEMILAASEATAIGNQIHSLRNQAAQEGVPEKERREIRKRIADLEKRPAYITYHECLAKLLKIQRGDFVGVLQAMEGLPVIIRLIDPPLHEFLPSYEELLEEITKLKAASQVADSKEIAQLLEEKTAMLKAVAGMREANPMLGLRGCRLGITYPAITEMQVRAIFEASCQLKKQKVDVHPEIMIPLVGHVNELKNQREALESVAQEVMKREKVKVDYKFGTMIEVPRAAITADEIAQYAEFFSFGTNDLTQTTFGYSRDDAEGKFLLQYVERKILPENPFQVLDRKGVGELVRMAVSKGRQTRPDIEIGICGEHGGDPSSIEFCHQVGLKYVSCSPFRVPIARLAAAHAAIREKSKVAEKDK